MAMVYGNAYLVIAASASQGDEVGMFPKLKDYYSETIDLKWNALDIRLKVEPFRSHISTLNTEGPLMSRSWTYQERLLARRVLLYNRDEVVWECNETWRCECGAGDKIGTAEHPYNLNRILIGDPQFIYKAWRNTVVKNYSHRRLTKTCDKLPALSGVAELFRTKLGDVYLAGLWRKDIINCLLWTCTSDSRNDLLPAYRAPSWSWASTDGTITYFELDNMGINVVVHEAFCEPLGKELTGEVKDGWITISGPLMKSWIFSPENVSFTLLYETESNSAHFSSVVVDGKIDFRLVQGENGQIEETAVRKINSATLNDARQSPTTDTATGRLCVWCLKIAQDTFGFRKLGYVLVLAKSQKNIGKFERIGIASVTDKNIAIFDKNASWQTITVV